MKKIEKFYESTKNSPPNENIKKFFELKNTTGNAIDIGCGAGRDTIYLLKNNWNVLAIDKENTESIIQSKVTKEELQRFRFVRQNFEDIKLEKCNLVVSNYSIPFCPKESFNAFWEKIVGSIQCERIFCRKFFWIK